MTVVNVADQIETAALAPTKPEKEPAMAGQKSARPKTRNLVRWTDDMDKKLLLTIQWACNKKGVKIPWEIVGHEMADTITESAVVQHLAKLRHRMDEEGLPVPPPLTRGGRNGKEDCKGPEKRRHTYRVSKRTTKEKKIARNAKDDSGLDSDEYNNDSEKKTQTRASAKSRVKQESSSPEHSYALGNASEEHEVQRYAVGDAMWDLGAKGASETKRERSVSSDQSSYQPSKVVTLKVGQKAFATLESSEGKNGNASRNLAELSDDEASDSGGSSGEDIGFVGDETNKGNDGLTQKSPSADYDDYQYFPVSELDLVEAKADHHFMPAGHSEAAFQGPNNSEAQNTTTAGFNKVQQFAGIQVAPGRASYFAQHGGYNVPIDAPHGSFNLPVVAEGYSNQGSGMTQVEGKELICMESSPFEDELPCFDDTHHRTNFSGFEGPSKFTANHFHIGEHHANSQLITAPYHESAYYQDLDMTGNHHAGGDDFGNYLGVEGMISAAALANDAGAARIQNDSSTFHSAPRLVVTPEGYDGSPQALYSQPQYTGQYDNGSPLIDRSDPTLASYPPYSSNESFKSDMGYFPGYAKKSQSAYHETPLFDWSNPEKARSFPIV
ncbi:MAG: hypothetical protein Q9170_007771 [Blastenia crenularia]